MVYGGQSCQLTCVFASVACDQLVAAVLPWPRQHGDEDAVFLDAFGGFLHGRILPHLKGMIRERMQLREWDLDDYILLRFCFLDGAGFTLSTYTHATAEMKRDAADAIGNVISQAM